MSAQAYPLQWPPGFPRSKLRQNGQFRSSYDVSLKNVIASLRKFGEDSSKKIIDPIMSSNINLLEKNPSDPGVAVWFIWDDMQVCIPVDRYNTPASNLQAIHHIIEARRVELRHGTLALVRATFSGFKALPPPVGKSWRDILQVTHTASREVIEANYRRLAKDRHPDAGGSADQMAELSNARDVAFKELGL